MKLDDDHIFRGLAAMDRQWRDNLCRKIRDKLRGSEAARELVLRERFMHDVDFWDPAGKESIFQLASEAMQGEKLNPHQQAKLVLRASAMYALEIRKEVGKPTLEWEANLAAGNMALELSRVTREWQAPPGEPRTAANLELVAMNAAYFALRSGALFTEHGVTQEVGANVCKLLAEEDETVKKVLAGLDAFYDRMPDRFDIGSFAEKWLISSFARVEVGHKLAASLCLTDTDNVEIEAPWPACSIIVPDGLIDVPGAEASNPHDISRVWCVGHEIVAYVTRSGFAMMRSLDDELAFQFGSGRIAKPAGEGARDRARFVLRALENFVRGVFLSLSNPEDFKKEKRVKRPSSTNARGVKRCGPPDLTQARYMLSAPVSVDLRDEVAAYVRGERKGGSPKVQFLVRGHWKQQAHGPRHSLRKTIWVQPFWKGDPEARVLLRNYKVEGPSEKT